jgi:hypothetical protein
LLKCSQRADVAADTWAPMSEMGADESSWLQVVPAARTSVISVEHFKLMESPNDRTVVRWLTSMARDACSGQQQSPGAR